MYFIFYGFGLGALWTNVVFSRPVYDIGMDSSTKASNSLPKATNVSDLNSIHV
jgi:hypothetical protein